MTDLETRIQAGLSGSYAIERLVGSGGMADVFLAQDLRHGRRVAIKVMRPDRAVALNEHRFLREIKVVARLTHPGILPVHDSGITDGLLYYVMPYVEDGSLADRLKREGELPVDQAIEIATEIGEAVSYAHAQGIVHRDLKPQNILMESGRPVIADFGLALALDDGATRTSESGFALGTPAYMSPEQASGSLRIDGRADQYALGCILYEMLAGQPPITGSNVQALIARKLAGQVPRLRVVRPTVPAHMEHAITRALAPVPADRFATVERFIHALRAEPSRVARWAPALVTLAVVSAVAAATLARGQAVAIDPNTVVVDEFENHTGDSTLAGIGASVADWTTEGLLETRLTAVIPTPSALQATRYSRQEAGKGARVDPLALVARETGAGVVVSGDYYEDGGRMTFHAQISDASSGVWQRLFGRGVSVRLRTALSPVSVRRDSADQGIALVRARVMGALAMAHGRTNSAAPQLDRTPPTYEAYQQFAAGMDAYVATDFPRASEAFLAAYRRDTTFVVSLLYGALSASNLQQWATEDSLLRIVARSRDQLPAYYRLWLEYRQLLLSGDRAAALRAIRAVSTEAPRSKATYNLAVEAWEDGHLDEALGTLRSLTPEIGPVRGFFPYWVVLANVQHLLGDYREALKTSRHASELYPGKLIFAGLEMGAMAALGQIPAVLARARTLAGASVDDAGWSPGEALREAAEELRAHGHRDAADTVWNVALRWYESSSEAGSLNARDQYGWAHALYALARYGEAEQVARRLSTAAPQDMRVAGLLGTIEARRGDSVTARTAIDRLSAVDRPYQFGRPVFYAALIAAASGDGERALQLLRRARAQGRSYGQWMHTEIDLEPIRSMPGYIMLVRPVPLKPAT